MENQVDEYEDWDKLVRKIVAAKAKIALQPASYIREMDQHFSRGNRPIFTTNTGKNVGSTLKYPCTKDLNSKNFGSGSGSASPL